MPFFALVTEQISLTAELFISFRSVTKVLCRSMKGFLVKVVPLCVTNKHDSSKPLILTKTVNFLFLLKKMQAVVYRVGCLIFGNQNF